MPLENIFDRSSSGAGTDAGKWCYTKETSPKKLGGGKEGWRGSTSSAVLILGAPCKPLPPTRSRLVSPPAVVASSGSLWQPRLTLIRLAGAQELPVERAGTPHEHQKRRCGATHLPKRFSIIGRKALIINNNYFAPALVQST